MYICNLIVQLIYIIYYVYICYIHIIYGSVHQDPWNKTIPCTFNFIMPLVQSNRVVCTSLFCYDFSSVQIETSGMNPSCNLTLQSYETAQNTLIYRRHTFLPETTTLNSVQAPRQAENHLLFPSETGSHYASEAGFKLLMQLKLTFNSLSSSCRSLSSAGIMNMHYDAQLDREFQKQSNISETNSTSSVGARTEDVSLLVESLPSMYETWVQSPAPEKLMVTHACDPSSPGAEGRGVLRSKSIFSFILSSRPAQAI